MAGKERNKNSNGEKERQQKIIQKLKKDNLKWQKCGREKEKD